MRVCYYMNDLKNTLSGMVVTIYLSRSCLSTYSMVESIY